MTTFLVFVAGLLGFMVLGLWQQRVMYRREAFIREYTLPQGLFEQLRKKRPELDLKQCQLVARALRQFFLAHLKSGRRYVSMPSQVADDLWHEFILHTRHYELFCRGAFGRFLHHTPAVAVRGGNAQAAAGLRRCWWQVCREEHINPKAPTRLPLLFALDAKLGVAGGFAYALDCSGVPRREGEHAGSTSVTYCGAELSSACGSADGGAGAGSGDGAGGGGSDGCGGGGCGGGD